MAKERQERTISFKIGDLIKQQTMLFNNIVITERNRKDANFARQIIDLGLSSAEQISYYNNLLTDENNKKYLDNNYISEVKNKIATLKKMKRAEDYADVYRVSYEAYKTQQKSIDDHLNFLENQLSAAVDENIKDNIKDSLTTFKQEKFNISNTILENQVNFALKDTRIDLLNKAISDAQTAKNQAVIGGDDLSSQKWDLSLQALQAQKQVAVVSNIAHNIEIKGITKPYTPISLLEEYNKQIGLASFDQNPFTINGIKYNSVQEYFQRQTTNYLDTKFFALTLEQAQVDIETASLKLTPELENTLKTTYNELKGLKSDSLFSLYLDKIDNVMTQIASIGTAKLAEKVLYDYQNMKMGVTSAKNITNTIDKLNNIAKTYDVDISEPLQKVINDVSNKKSYVAQNIINTYQNEIQRQIDEGETTDTLKAWQIAQRVNAAIDIPSLEILGKTPMEIAKETVASLEQPSKYAISETKPTTEVGKVSEAKPLQATLYDPMGVDKPKVVDVGSAEASNLQSQGWTLTPVSRDKIKQDMITQGYTYIPDPSYLSKLTADQIERKGEMIFAKPSVVVEGLTSKPAVSAPITTPSQQPVSQPTGSSQPAPSPAPTPQPKTYYYERSGSYYKVTDFEKGLGSAYAGANLPSGGIKVNAPPTAAKRTANPDLLKQYQAQFK